MCNTDCVRGHRSCAFAGTKCPQAASGAAGQGLDAERESLSLRRWRETDNPPEREIIRRR